MILQDLKPYPKFYVNASHAFVQKHCQTVSMEHINMYGIFSDKLILIQFIFQYFILLLFSSCIYQYIQFSISL